MPRPSVTSRSPNMTDVADRAGVSIATVSNVINGKGRVSKATATRVRTVMAELGFVRNDAARLLATGRTNSVGMILSDLDNSLFVDMAHGAQQGADERDLRLLLGNTVCDIDRQDDYLRLFDEARVAGVLLAPMQDSAAGIEQIRSHGRPIVLLNYRQQGIDCCMVLTDNCQVGYLAAQHLISLGRRRLAFVAGRTYFQPVTERRQGVRQAVTEASGVTLKEIDAGGILFDDGAAIGRQLAATDHAERPDGVIAVTDDLANGLGTGLQDASSLRVPADIAVVGCEDNRSAPYGPLPLTTVQLDGIGMGAAAIELLLEEMTDANHVHRIVVTQPSLVVRASTAPVSP